VLVTAATDDEALRLAGLLEAVGFRQIRGLVAGGVQSWRDAGHETASIPAVDVPGLAARLRAGDVHLLDVRDDDEWDEGHVDGSTHVPYHQLRNGIPEDLRAHDVPLAVACSIGNRSSIAASLLARAGVDDLVHVVDGGVADLAREGVALVRE
jgi:hydroxyacylglutathione hydrolase